MLSFASCEVPTGRHQPEMIVPPECVCLADVAHCQTAAQRALGAGIFLLPLTWQPSQELISTRLSCRWTASALISWATICKNVHALVLPFMVNNKKQAGAMIACNMQLAAPE